MIEVERSLIKASKYGRSVMVPPGWIKHLRIKGFEVNKVKLEIYDDRIILFPILEQQKSK